MKKFFTILFLLSTALLTGCGNVVDEGMIAVKKNMFTGKYEDGYAEQGWHFPSIYNFIDVDSREMVIPISTDPKDSDGVALNLVKVEMRVSINNFDGIVPALRKNLRIEDNHMLGISRLTSDGVVSLRQVAETMKAEIMFSDNATFAKNLVTKYQKNLNINYPNLFTVTQANVLKVDVPDFIQSKISSVAAKAAEIERNAASESAIESKKSLQKKEAELIRDFMKDSNLNPEQFVEMEKIKMIREIYEDSNSSNNKDSSLPTLIVNMSK